MKKLITLSLLVTAFSFAGIAQKSSRIIENALALSVEAKVSGLQKIIEFSDDQAAKIKEVELEYLLGVQKSEKCFLCSKKRRLVKLNKSKEQALREILSSDAYRKYDMIDSDRIKNIPVRLE